MFIPTDLVEQLRSRHSIPVFVETGTYRGDTAAWASRHFARVYTIERSLELFESAKRRHASRNIVFVNADTRAGLETVLRDVGDSKAVFWLDAHWSGGATVGADDECPLLDELSLIQQSARNPYIFVDDARLFFSPPPAPHDYNHWPTIDQVVLKLRERKDDGYIAVFDDVILSVPAEAKATAIGYLSKAAARRTAGQTIATYLRSIQGRIRTR